MEKSLTAPSNLAREAGNDWVVCPSRGRHTPKRPGPPVVTLHDPFSPHVHGPAWSPEERRWLSQCVRFVRAFGARVRLEIVGDEVLYFVECAEGPSATMSSPAALFRWCAHAAHEVVRQQWEIPGRRWSYVEFYRSLGDAPPLA